MAPALAAIAALSCLQHAARAQDGDELAPAAARGAYEHDGFLARIAIGPAFGAIAERADVAVLDAGVARVDEAALDVTGGGLALSLDAGASITSRFAWLVRLSQCVLPDPKLDGVAPEGRGESARTLALLAPGLSWFGPFGLSATVAAGIAFTRRQTYDGEGGFGDAGLGANLDLGIEGWVAEQFALGAVVRGWWSSTAGSSRDGDRSQRALAAALALSLTYQ